MPLLLNFPDIFRDRIRTQHACFADAIERYLYHGSYACAFPVKANHSGDLVRSVLLVFPPRRLVTTLPRPPPTGKVSRSLCS